MKTLPKVLALDVSVSSFHLEYWPTYKRENLSDWSFPHCDLSDGGEKDLALDTSFVCETAR